MRCRLACLYAGSRWCGRMGEGSRFSWLGKLRFWLLAAGSGNSAKADMMCVVSFREQGSLPARLNGLPVGWW